MSMPKKLYRPIVKNPLRAMRTNFLFCIQCRSICVNDILFAALSQIATDSQLINLLNEKCILRLHTVCVHVARVMQAS